MKTKITFPFFVLFVAVLLNACEETIDFDSEIIEPKIVVNSVLVSGSKYCYISVQKSRSVLNDNNFFESLPNAEVKLYEDGAFLREFNYVSHPDTFINHLEYGAIEKHAYDAGYYLDSTLVIQSGSTYRLEVSCEGFDPVFCETTVPLPVELNKLDCSLVKKPDEYNDNLFKLKMKLSMHDDRNEKDYYHLSVSQNRGIELALLSVYGTYGDFGGSVYGWHSTKVDLDTVVPTDTIIVESVYGGSVNSVDPVLSSSNNTDILDVESEYIDYFSDELMNSEDYCLSFWKEFGREVYTDFGEYMKVFVGLEHVSEELFFYVKSRQEQYLASDNPFAEPVPVYSNVVGGMGIFASLTRMQTSAIIGDYPIDEKTYIDRQEYNKMIYGEGY